MLKHTDFKLPPSKRVYVASSWRNNLQPAIVEIVRAAGLEVYDFKNPDGKTGFSWKDVNPDWSPTEADPEGRVTTDEYIKMVHSPVAATGFAADFQAMQWCDTVIYVLPCGKSASIELGWGVGSGRKTCVFLGENPMQPELMYRVADFITDSTMDLLAFLGVKD